MSFPSTDEGWELWCEEYESNYWNRKSFDEDDEEKKREKEIFNKIESIGETFSDVDVFEFLSNNKNLTVFSFLIYIIKELKKEINVENQDCRFNPNVNIDTMELDRLEKDLKKATEMIFKHIDNIDQLKEVLKYNNSKYFKKKAVKKLIELKYGKT